MAISLRRFGPRQKRSGFVAEFHYVVESLFSCLAREVVTHHIRRIDGTFQKRDSTVVTKEIEVMGSDYHIGLAFASRLLLCRHVGHLIHILDIEERPTYSHPIIFFIWDETHLCPRNPVLSIRTVVTVGVFLPSARPVIMRFHQVGDRVEIVVVKLTAGSVVTATVVEASRTIQRPGAVMHRPATTHCTVSGNKRPISIEFRREDGIYRNINSRCLLKESVTEPEVVTACGPQ